MGIYRFLTPPGLLGLALVGITPCMASSITSVPPGLAPGSQYRLIFFTDNVYSAASSDIATYNTDVNEEANDTCPGGCGIGIESPLAALGLTWLDIGSTSTVNAINNIGSDPGVPIYNLDGQLEADDATTAAGSLFSANYRFANPLTDEFGDTGSGSYFIWTGTGLSGGTVYCNGICYPLGSGGDVALGNTNPSASSAFKETDGYYTNAYGLYGISGILTVPPSTAPEPSTPVMMALGGAAMLFAMRRKPRRRAPLRSSRDITNSAYRST